MKAKENADIQTSFGTSSWFGKNYMINALKTQKGWYHMLYVLNGGNSKYLFW